MSPRRLLGRSARAEQATAPAADDLQAELVLLREENARLKAEAHREPAAAAVLELALALPAAGPEDGAADDDVAHALVEGLVLRDGLRELGDQLEQAMRAVEAHLEVLGAQGAGRHALACA
jgi:hypothetical protein